MNTRRTLIPGAFDHFGVARPHRIHGCTGGCHQGDLACDCDTELSLDVAPDAARVIQPPILTPEDLAYIARVRRWALVVATAGIALLAALLELFGAREFRL